MGSDLGIKLPEYDFLGDAKSNIDKIKEQIKSIIPIVAAVGAAFLAWKIGNTILDLINNPSILKGFSGNILKVGKSIWQAFVSPSGKTIKLSSILGNSTVYVGIAAQIAAIAATAAIIVGQFANLYINSERFRAGLSAIGNVVVKAFGFIINTFIPTIGNFFAKLIPHDLITNISNIFAPIKEQLDKIDVGAADWLLTLGSIALLFTPAAPFATAVLIFEGLFVAIRAIGYGASDALEAVDLFSDDISETTKSKVAPFVEQMRGLEDVMKSIEWTGTIIDDALVEDVKVKTAAIRDTIVNELDSDKNEALATLEPLKAALSAEAYAKLVADNKAYYAGMVTQITDSEAEINSIMATAKAENRTLTQEEANKINEIQANMKDNGVLH
ncbi:MAG: hypothetical protein RSA20_09655, partial [Oscillospiraceae bacterium]